MLNSAAASFSGQTLNQLNGNCHHTGLALRITPRMIASRCSATIFSAVSIFSAFLNPSRNKKDANAKTADSDRRRQKRIRQSPQEHQVSDPNQRIKNRFDLVCLHFCLST